jgi:hypothetical protein
LTEFRRDLALEMRANLDGIEEAELDRLFRLVYDMHHWLATGSHYRDFEAQFRDQPVLVSLLRAVQPHSSGNVEMLGAILQRMIMDGVEAGKPLDAAVEQAAQAHQRVASESPFDTASCQ